MPPSILLCSLNRSKARRPHPPFGRQHLDALDVALGPEAPAATGREALQVEVFVEGLALAVDPAVAEGGVDGF